jgi:hypothetical protein
MYVTRTAEKKYVRRGLVGNFERKRPIGRIILKYMLKRI